MVEVELPRIRANGHWRQELPQIWVVKMSVVLAQGESPKYSTIQNFDQSLNSKIG